jgi:hypothetical protein
MVNAGLWSRSARLKETHADGAWGKVFTQVAEGEAGGIQAHSVQSIASKINVSEFDIVKIDIEGEASSS